MLGKRLLRSFKSNFKWLHLFYFTSHTIFKLSEGKFCSNLMANHWCHHIPLHHPSVLHSNSVCKNQETLNKDATIIVGVHLLWPCWVRLEIFARKVWFVCGGAEVQTNFGSDQRNKLSAHKRGSWLPSSEQVPGSRLQHTALWVHTTKTNVCEAR